MQANCGAALCIGMAEEEIRKLRAGYEIMPDGRVMSELEHKVSIGTYINEAMREND